MNAPTARPSFFAELQRRHVYKVGAMYAVAGWLLVQVITQVFPIYDISAHLQRIFVGVIIAGFPVALVLAWLFDITPQGILRTGERPVNDEAGPVSDTAVRIADSTIFIGAPLAISLVYVAIDRAGYLIDRQLPRKRRMKPATRCRSRTCRRDRRCAIDRTLSAARI